MQTSKEKFNTYFGIKVQKIFQKGKQTDNKVEKNRGKISYLGNYHKNSKI